MGHFIFIVLHLVAILFTGFVFLFLTIPLHIIYAVIRSNGKKTAKAIEAAQAAQNKEEPT
ncbi:MAG: hypothetical protein AB2745_08445 [Candidatus Thiodiazotropha endolucinida]